MHRLVIIVVVVIVVIVVVQHYTAACTRQHNRLVWIVFALTRPVEVMLCGILRKEKKLTTFFLLINLFWKGIFKF